VELKLPPDLGEEHGDEHVSHEEIGIIGAEPSSAAVHGTASSF
jgi:hypothetical protein